MDSKLLSEVRTTSEADLLLDELEQLKRSLYEHGERSFESTLKGQVRFWVAEIIRGEVKDTDTEKYLINMIQRIEELEEFKLTLAFEPSSTGLNRMLSFVRENINENLILELKYDPSIIGGSLISYNGKYHDFSMKDAFDHEFEKQREKYLRMLKVDN